MAISPDYNRVHSEFDSQAYVSAETARLNDFGTAWKYYDGLHKRHLKVKQDAGAIDDNVTINLCGILVDRSVARLFGDPVRGELLTFDVEPEDKEKEAKALEQEGKEAPAVGTSPEELDAQKVLDEAWERAGGLDRFLSKLGTFGSVCGQFVIKLVRDEPDEDDSDKTPLRPIALDPALVGILTAPDDADTETAYKIQYLITVRDPDQPDRYVEADFRQLIVDGETYGGDDAWFVKDFVRLRKGLEKDRRWVPYGEDIEDVWNICPIYTGQNLPHARDVWGMSDMSNVMNLNDEINFLLSNVNRIVRYHAHPRTIGIGVDAKSIQETSVESFWTVPTTPDKANIFNLEMKSDLSAIFDFFQVIRESFWTIGREADPATFKERIGNVTNFGLRVLFLDALNKLGQKRQTYGRALSRMCESILIEAGIEDMEVSPRWVDPLPNDPREEVETMVLEIDAGIMSKETAARERGRNWLVEKSRIKKETDDEGFGNKLLQTMRGDGVAPTKPQARPNADVRQLRQNPNMDRGKMK